MPGASVLVANVDCDDPSEVRPPTDPTTPTWRAILRGEHPLVAWLDGEADVESLPELFPDGSSARQLFASNPFPGPSRWLRQATAIAS